MASIFEAAVADRLIAASPCARIAVPERTDTEVVPQGVGQVAELAAAVPLRYRALIVFAAGTGLRQGECFGLSLDRLDFLRRRIRVDRQLTAARGGVPTFGPPKSKAGFRTVPMPDTVATTLAEHLARYGTGPVDPDFTNTAGRPLRRNTAGDMWHRASTPRRHRILRRTVVDGTALTATYLCEPVSSRRSPSRRLAPRPSPVP